MKSEISCKLTVVSQSDGSGEFIHGNTSAMASVYGPNEMKQSKELITNMNIEVSFKPKVSSQMKEKLLIETFLANICTDLVFIRDFPKSNLTIVVQELENDGSLLACSVNAIALALMESAIPLKSIFAAVNVAMDTDGGIIINPSLKQELELPSTTFVFNKACDLICSQTSKCSSETTYEMCLNASLNYIKTIFDIYKNKITELY